MNPSTTAAVVLCHPAGMVSPALLYWLQDIGIARRRTLFNPGNKWSWAVAMNDSCRRVLDLPARIDTVIFADNDVRPSKRATAPMLEQPYDVTCSRCDIETGPDAWTDLHAFHTGLFILRRRVLHDMAPPWFAWSTTEDGAAMTGCGCASFAARVEYAGFTIGHAGTAEHDHATSSPKVPFICP